MSEKQYVMSECSGSHFKEINITYEGIETKWTKMTPRVLRKRVEQIYEYLPTDPQRAINEILTIYLKHKELPVLNSYLCQAYNAIGDFDKAEKAVVKNYRLFPGYLFAKTNYAHLCLYRGDIDQIHEIFEQKADLQSLYPRRKVFHYTEYLAFMSVWAMYYDKIHKNELAITFYNYMKSTFKDIFFQVPLDISIAGLTGRAILLLILFVWGWKLIFSSIASNTAGESVLHLVNLPFHEAGHIFFRPFGSFMTSLGGTLGQLLIPLICIVVFLLQTRDTFAAAVGLWWFGENFLDIAPYINDARAGVLPLLGGNRGHSSPYGFHDWEYLLTETGLREYDRTIALLAHGTGSILMLLAITWGSYILWKSYWESL